MDTFTGLDYTVLTYQRDGKFYLYIAELSLIAEDERLEGAWEKLEAAKRNYFENVCRLGLEESVALPEPTQTKRFLKREMVSFLLKSCILSGLLLGVLVIFLSIVDIFAEKGFSRMPERLKRSMKENIEALPGDLIEAVNSAGAMLEQMPEEEREEFYRNAEALREIVNTIFFPAYSDPNQLLSPEKAALLPEAKEETKPLETDP